MTEAINVVLMDFHCTEIKEALTHNEDDSYTIFLNSRYNKEQLQLSYLHALSHIEHDDFHNGGDINQIEAERHKSW